MVFAGAFAFVLVVFMAVVVPVADAGAFGCGQARISSELTVLAAAVEANNFCMSEYPVRSVAIERVFFSVQGIRS